MAETLLSVDGLRVEFKTRDGIAKVIDNLSISLDRGETLGIVGESGCGKSMTALSIMGLVPVPPGRIAGGRILLDDEDLLQASEARMRQVRGNEISMIFQEPMTSLNPVYSIGNQIAETARLHEGLSRADAMARALEMLRAVGIPAAEKRIHEFPHQMSGGMRQRVMIAMALACKPRVLIADEPTTALDVTVQAQIFDLLNDLKQKTGTAIIMITHDMGAIAEMAQRVVVMYAGRIIEQADVGQILTDPRHPYTQGLIRCVPHLTQNPSVERPPLLEIPGVVPALSQLGQGCAFAPRCQYADAKCRAEMPTSSTVDGGHDVACWLAEREAAA
ncbi:MAG: ABC transporter ATP-binding protein [Alphaproteobacteria bacterium]|jgi:peptide/nickel transport system ATP-binding protein|nr:ABC transporter ATP-binding protein [Alphaproteobacteria bacterium]